MSVDPHDDTEIEDHHFIIRRVDPSQHVVPDNNTGKLRISSKLITPSSGVNEGMSVDLLSAIQADGVDAKDFVCSPKYIAAVRFLAGIPREKGGMIGADPIPDNPYHAQVWGSIDRPNRFSKSLKNGIRRNLEWFVVLKDVEL